MPGMGEQIGGLTKELEIANTLQKSASGVVETIAKTLKSLFDTFFQPVGNLVSKALYEIWKLMQPLIDAFGGVVEFFKNSIEWVNENIFKPVEDWIVKNIINPILEFIKNNGITEWIERVKQAFWLTVNDWLSSIERLKQAFWMTVNDWLGHIERLKQAFWLTINDWLKNFETLKTAFWKTVEDWKKTLSTVYDKFVEVVGKIVSNITTKFDEAVRTVGTLVSNITKPFKDVIDTIVKTLYNGLASFVNKALGVSILGDALKLAGVKQMAIQSFATGGVVPGSGPQLAVVHGGENIIPNGQSGSNITLNFYGYQDELFIRKVRDVIRKEGSVYTL